MAEIFSFRHCRCVDAVLSLDSLDKTCKAGCRLHGRSAAGVARRDGNQPVVN